MNSQRARFWGGLSLVSIAVLIALAEVVIHIYGKYNGKHYDVGHIDLLVALVIGFVGMYVLSPKGAKDGGQFLVDNALRVITVIRSGRRKTDMMKVVVENQEGQQTSIDVPPLETEVAISQENDATPRRRSSDEFPIGGSDAKIRSDQSGSSGTGSSGPGTSRE